MVNIKLGDVYERPGSRNYYRIIGFDEREVFFDVYSYYSEKWELSDNLHKKLLFLRTSIECFIEAYNKIDEKPFSVMENEIIRPDLPIRIGITTVINWGDIKLTSQNELNSIGISGKLNCDKIGLMPFGPKGGLKQEVILSANENNCFNFSELFVKANNLVQGIKPIKEGIGIYRGGLVRKKPLYFMGYATSYLDHARQK